MMESKEKSIYITLSPFGASSKMTPCKIKPNVASPDFLILSWELAHHLPCDK